MNTLESLNKEFQEMMDWKNNCHKRIMKYMDKCLVLCGGKAEMPVKYPTYETAEQAGADFLGQFPSCVQVMDEQGWDWIYSLYVIRLYKQNGKFQKGRSQESLALMSLWIPS